MNSDQQEAALRDAMDASTKMNMKFVQNFGAEYVMNKKIGEGGFGEVHLATQKQTDI